MAGRSGPAAPDPAGLPGGPRRAGADGIRVFAAGATKEVVIRIAPAFVRARGIAVVPLYDTVGALRDRVLRGEACDVALLSGAAVAALDGAGLVEPGSRRGLGAVAVGLAVRKGAFLPDISTPAALKRVLLAAESISHADPANGATAGNHFAGVLARLGIADAVAPRLTLLPFGVDVIDAVAEGRFEIGVSQSSEISLHPGVRLVGPLPEPHALLTPYEAAVAIGAAAGAWSFVDFLQSDDGARALREAGFRKP